jgi:hypothetical protein
LRVSAFWKRIDGKHRLTETEIFALDYGNCWPLSPLPSSGHLKWSVMST